MQCFPASIVQHRAYGSLFRLVTTLDAVVFLASQLRQRRSTWNAKSSRASRAWRLVKCSFTTTTRILNDNNNNNND